MSPTELSDAYAAIDRARTCSSDSARAKIVAPVLARAFASWLSGLTVEARAAFMKANGATFAGDAAAWLPGLDQAVLDALETAVAAEQTARA